MPLSIALVGALAFAVVGRGQDFEPAFDAPWIGYDTAVYPEGIHPVSAASGDLTGDGATDLATVSWGGTAHLSILEGDGNGGFLPPVTYPLFIESLGVVAADFDNDGDLDLAVNDTGRFWEGFTVSLWRNNGAGVFSLSGQFNSGENGPSGITASDFDGDGFVDIAVAHDDYIVSGNTIAVLFNNRAGGFGPPHVITVRSGTRAIDSGDLDGDGDPDIAVGLESNRFTLVWHDNGTFTVGQTLDGVTAGSIPEWPQVHVSDIDLDQDQDIFFSNVDSGGPFNGAVGLWRNDGAGGFGPAETISFNRETGGFVQMTTSDVTGDGWPDALGATYFNDEWWLLESDGAGGFRNPRYFRAGQAPISIQTSDLDGDSDRDVIVVASGSLEACVYRNPGDGEFIQPVPIDMTEPALAPAFPTNIESGDIDRDGDLDLVVGYRADFAGAHGISVRKNNGDGSFGPIDDYPNAPYPITVRLEDLDVDGDLDIIWVDADGRFKTRMNGGNGTFGSPQTRRTVYRAEYFELWDVDRDGDPDIVTGDGFDAIVMLNEGFGSFGPPIRTVVSDFFEALGMGEFNGDGILDLLTNSAIQGYAEVSFGLGDGRFQSPRVVTTGRSAQAFDSADLNHDGVGDFVAVYNLDEKGLSVRLGRGNGDFFPLENYHGSRGFVDHTSDVILRDATDDGEHDAMTANFSPQDLSLWRGNADGSFERLERYGVAEHAVDVTFGDFDGDGIGDAMVITQVDAGRWWYPGVVMLKGLIGSPPDLRLTQTELRQGQPAAFTASGASTGETVYFLYSLRGTGVGPCPPQLGGLCLDILTPVELVGEGVTNADGVARIVRTVPAQAPLGLPVYTQAVVRRGAGGGDSVKSNTISDAVRP
ncbi:MAG: FG-GAP repeat domain-containing protein [Phycisphaerales bacterium]